MIGGVDCSDTFFGCIRCFQRVAGFEAIVDTSDPIEPVLRRAVWCKIPSICHVVVLWLKLLSHRRIVVDLSVECLRYGLGWHFYVKRKSELDLDDEKKK